MEPVQESISKIVKIARLIRDGQEDTIVGFRKIYSLWSNSNLPENELYYLLVELARETNMIIKGDIQKNFSETFITKQRGEEKEILNRVKPQVDEILDKLLQPGKECAVNWIKSVETGEKSVSKLKDYEIVIKTEREALNEIVRIAQLIKEGKKDIALGFKEIWSLWLNSDLPRDDLFYLITGIESETEEFIKEDDQKKYSADFLAKQSIKERETLEFYRSLIEEALDKILQLPVVEIPEDPYAWPFEEYK